MEGGKERGGMKYSVCCGNMSVTREEGGGRRGEGRDEVQCMLW